MEDGVLVVRGLRRELRGWKGRPFHFGPADLEIAPGETVGVAGPNGAGKSTLLALLAGVLRPDGGSLAWKRAGSEDAIDPRAPAWRARVALLRARESAFYPNLGARENLRFFGELSGLGARAAARRAGDALERVGLDERADEPVRQYSSGMQARLALARALMRDAELLLLDEPERSLDAQSAAAFLELLRHGLDGRRALWVTHGGSALERGAARILHLRDGRLVPAPAPGGWLIRASGGEAHAGRAGLVWDDDAGALRLAADGDPARALDELRAAGAAVLGLERERRGD